MDTSELRRVTSRHGGKGRSRPRQSWVLHPAFSTFCSKIVRGTLAPTGSSVRRIATNWSSTAWRTKMHRVVRGVHWPSRAQCSATRSHAGLLFAFLVSSISHFLHDFVMLPRLCPSPLVSPLAAGIHKCTHTHLHTYTHIHTHIHTCIHIQKHKRTKTQKHAHMRSCTQTNIQTCTHTHTNQCENSDIRSNQISFIGILEDQALAEA